MKYRIILMLGCYVFANVCAADDAACKKFKNESPAYKLKQKLMCNYDWTEGPTRTHRENATRISVYVIPKFFEFDKNNMRKLKLHTWTMFAWNDPQLVWNPADYDGMSILRIESYELWIPDNVLSFNNIDMNEEQNVIASTKCQVSSDGGVIWIPTVTYGARCVSDHTNWPFDTKNCTFALSSWEYPANKIILGSHDEENAIMDEFLENMQWELLKINFSFGLMDMKLDSEFKSSFMHVEMHLQNRSTAFAIHILYTFVLMVLTSSILWLEPNTLEQAVVTSISFICHFISMMYLVIIFQDLGSVTPNIVLFYERSLIITTFVMLVTTLQREMLEFNCEVPKWMLATVIYILRSKPGQILLLGALSPQATYLLERSEDDNVDLATFKKKESAWRFISLMLGWIVFLCISFTYLVMLAVLIPT